MIALLYIPFCIFWAWVNKRWIAKVNWAKNKKIRHFWNGLLHFTVAVIVASFTEWYHFISVLAIARLFFDTALYVMKDLGIAYVTPTPKSLVDRVEQAIFKKNWWLPKIIYVLLIFVLQVLRNQ